MYEMVVTVPQTVACSSTHNHRPAEGCAITDVTEVVQPWYRANVHCQFCNGCCKRLCNGDETVVSYEPKVIPSLADLGKHFV